MACTGVYWPQGAGRPFHSPKNSHSLGHAFFDAKPYREQLLLKAFCAPWKKHDSDFEKKTFWLLNKVGEGKQIEKCLQKRKCGENQQL